jgi:hypothetical protein
VPGESAFKSRLDIDSCLCNTDTGWTELVESYLYTMHMSLLFFTRVVCIIPLLPTPTPSRTLTPGMVLHSSMALLNGLSSV